MKTYINYTAIPKFSDVLSIVQNDIVTRYSEVFTDESRLPQLKSYIGNSLEKYSLKLDGVSRTELVDILYNEMAESSFLTPYLDDDDVEEININSWDDIVITTTDGMLHPLEQHFVDPDHAVNTVKRMLKKSDGIIDDAKALAQGHLPGNKRITAIKTPVVDKNIGISASIRLLHPNRVTRKALIDGDSMTQEMLEFLCDCLANGCSFVIVGATSSGKTTLLNCLLGTIPDHKRVYVIESGTRELDLVKRDDDGRVVNNVVSTLTRLSDDPKLTIEQDDLVVTSLRFSPNIIVVGEMRDKEAHAAVEASLTGHTVVTTVHASGIKAAHTRIAMLMQKLHAIDFRLSLSQAAEAFPLVIYEQRLDDNSRKVMDIAEVIVDEDQKVKYNSLYRYIIDDSWEENGKTRIKGHFIRCGVMSEDMKTRLVRGGLPMKRLKRYLDVKDGGELKETVGALKPAAADTEDEDPVMDVNDFFNGASSANPFAIHIGNI